MALLTAALLLSACQWEKQKQEQALKTARSWLSSMASTCDGWEHHTLPTPFARNAVQSAQQQLQKTYRKLPPVWQGWLRRQPPRCPDQLTHS